MNNKQNHPADIADELERLPAAEAQQELRELSTDEAAAIVAELDEESRPAVLEGFTNSEMAALVREMPHEAAADVLADMSLSQQAAVLESLGGEDQGSITQLMTYPPDTAGGIMSDQFLTLRADQTVESAIQEIRGLGEEYRDQVLYLYVTDAKRKLVGIVSLHDLVFKKPERTIAEVMRKDVAHAVVSDDQEKVAQLFERYHYMALPVLEQDGRLVGLVMANDVVDVLQEEATEDMQRMVGISHEERVLTPWRLSIKRRLPWLCVNLGTAFLAAAVVGLFEETIAAWTALAIFLPIVAGQGGNAGAQTLTVIIRDMALGNLEPGDGRKAMKKEMILGLANGIIIGLIVAVCGYIWKGSAALGLVVGVAMVMNMVMAGFAGVAIPYFLKSIRVDPALASSIFVTTFTDVAGFFFFLGLAALVIYGQ